MLQWRIKEISNLTQVSVRMLRHYDKVGLLKPSGRSSNGYRWYSEQDLAKLQQIVALKFFGFSLSTIKTMLQQKLSIQEHLGAQKEMLAQQTEYLQMAQETLEVILKQYETSKSLDWNNLITLIERYNMTQELKNTWVGKLNPEGQANYIEIRQKFPKEIKAWEKSIEAINNKQVGDPDGPDGEHAVEAMRQAMHAIQKFEEKNRKPTKISEISNTEILKAIREHLEKRIPLTPEGSLWYAKASIAYSIKCWEKVYNSILKNIEEDPEGPVGKKIAKSWRELIESNYIGMSPEFWVGANIWKDAVKAKSEMAKQPDLKEIKLDFEKVDFEKVQKMAPEIFFNPQAMAWIQRALGKQ